MATSTTMMGASVTFVRGRIMLGWGILLGLALLCACLRGCQGRDEEVVVARLRSGAVTTTTSGSSSSSGETSSSLGVPLHRKDARWAQAARALRSSSRPARRRAGRIVLDDDAARCASAAAEPGRWWKGREAEQAVVSFGEAFEGDSVSALRAALGTHGAVADFLAGDRYLLVHDARALTLKELLDRLRTKSLQAAAAPYGREHKVSPELAALVEVLESTEVSTSEEEGAPAAELFQISRDLSLQVLAKGAEHGSHQKQHEEEKPAPSPSSVLPTKALDLRLKGASNETLDFFSAAVDGRTDRLLLSASTPSVPGLKGRQVRAHLERVASSCGFGVVESPRDLYEEGWEAAAGGMATNPKHLSLKIAVPRSKVAAAVEALALLPYVNWIEPELEVRVFNHIASTVLQVGSKGEDLEEEDPKRRPFWAAGLRGQGEIVGVGDTGLDTKSCFFWDPDHSVGYDHSKVIGYRGFADYEDTSGHGTHVCGSIAGRAGNESGYSVYNGMAPDARLAFTDLGLSYGDQRGLIAPETMEEYYEYAYGLGARLHSDSWGGLSTAYTRSAREVDEWHFYHPEFLAMIAAGNDGEFLSSEGVESTVSTPATCKNALAVGATLSMGKMDPPIDPVTNFEVAAPKSFARRKFQLVSSLFSPVFEFDKGEEIELVMTRMPRLCEDLRPNERDLVKGRIALVERGDCYFIDKVQRLVDAGALGAIIYNNEESGSGFFKMASSQLGQSMPIPAAAVPMSTGRTLSEAIKMGEAVGEAPWQTMAKIKFVSKSEESLPAYESIAEYSSFGPTMDGRVKPDVVAPGEEIKSATSVDSDNKCSTERISGTSMATPLVAGISAVVRQYLNGGYHPNGDKGGTKAEGPPSGSLIKGIIINGAAELKGFAQSGLPLEPAPSFRQGWGRVELDTALPLVGSGRALHFADWKDLKVTGDAHVYCLRTPQNFTSDETRRISVTINWMDAPGALSGGGYLVNDLDMEISVPEGSPGVSWGAAVRPDRINNVEKGVIEYPVADAEYKIRVSAHKIKWPMGNGRGQLYSLVAFGPEGFTLSECEGEEEEFRSGADGDRVQVAGWQDPSAIPGYDKDAPKGEED